jgi:hypothetical protein
MSHKHDHSASNQSERLPSFLAFYHAILEDKYLRILEDQTGGLEADFVLCEIPAALGFVPLEQHNPQSPYCNYIIVHTFVLIAALADS